MLAEVAIGLVRLDVMEVLDAEDRRELVPNRHGHTEAEKKAFKSARNKRYQEKHKEERKAYFKKLRERKRQERLEALGRSQLSAQ